MHWRSVPAGAAAAVFWRVFAINGALFAAGVLVLAFGPFTVSKRIVLGEFVVLLIGLVAVLSINAILVRRSLAPLDRLTELMYRVDPLSRNAIHIERGNDDLKRLIDSFNAMVERLHNERAAAISYGLWAQEDERRRLSRELHDQIGQSLTVALLNLGAVAANVPPEHQQLVENAQNSVRASLADARSIASALRPDVLDHLGLHSALVAVCNDYAAEGVVVERVLPAQLPRLSEDKELACFRIAQEGLTNVARHSGATKVQLAVHISSGVLKLSVADNGRGGITSHGAGLRGMRERAVLVGGALTIDSPLGGGTRVELSMQV